MVDIAILGGGPAGATLARLLDRRYSVVVLDRKRAETDPAGGGPSDFRKPCGGLLAPDAQRALSRFHLVLPKDVLVDPQIFAVRTQDVESGLVRHYQRFYMNLDRHRFDQWLLSLVPDSVDILWDSLATGIEPIPDGYRIRYRHRGAERILEARRIVGADGAHSLVRRFLYPGKRIRSYMAIQQWFPEEHRTPFYACLFDPRITDCYSWTISKDGCFIFGGAYPKHDARARFDHQKALLREAGYRFGEPIRTEGCLVLRPSRFRDIVTGRGDAFLIGEAGGFISPSSLEGISSALETARLLALALNSGNPDPARRYRRLTRPLRIRLYMKALKCPFLYHPRLRRLVMRSGIRSLGDGSGLL